jgi:hypothetical protein
LPIDAAEQNDTGEASEQRPDLSFSAVEIGGSAALGADVRLDLAPRITVLVGKNGAGKSLLLEKLMAGIFAAIGAARESDPARFASEVDVHGTNVEQKLAKLRYECRVQLREPAATDTSPAGLPIRSEADMKVEETCRIIHPREELLWQVDDGLLTYNTGEHAEIAAGRTLLNWMVSHRRPFVFSGMANLLRELFWNVTRVPPGVPRGDGEREELALPYPATLRGRSSMATSLRIRHLADRLVDWHGNDLERFEELVELGRRTGLLEEVKVKLYRDPEAGSGAQRRDLATVLVDGTNLGVLSDGTLRIIEILVQLLYPGVKLVLIEEPETAVHPGLLSRLLAEFDAYSSDRQLVLSTQAPQVVSWADPLAIRLVERRAGRTEVRNLRDDEVARLSAYLHDEGTLGDFVYSGALDD